MNDFRFVCSIIEMRALLARMADHAGDGIRADRGRHGAVGQVISCRAMAYFALHIIESLRYIGLLKSALIAIACHMAEDAFGIILLAARDQGSIGLGMGCRTPLGMLSPVT